MSALWTRDPLYFLPPGWRLKDTITGRSTETAKIKRLATKNSQFDDALVDSQHSCTGNQKKETLFRSTFAELASAKADFPLCESSLLGPNFFFYDVFTSAQRGFSSVRCPEARGGGWRILRKFRMFGCFGKYGEEVTCERASDMGFSTALRETQNLIFDVGFHIE